MTQVTLSGNPIHLHGHFPKLGSKAPEISLTTADLQDIQALSNFSGLRKILNIFPSIDTGVCATSVRRFNEQASALENTRVLCISADLPMAQKRFCAAEGLNNVVMLSSFRHPESLEAYGVQIQEGPLRGLASRAVLVLDEHDQILHAELVEEITHEPNYAAALQALQ